MEVSARLLQIQISNFKSFRNVVTVKDIDDKNNLIGERHNVKQDLVTAVYFGLGATVTELGVDKLDLIQADPSKATYVELTLGLKDSTVRNKVVRRTLKQYAEKERFDYKSGLTTNDITVILYRTKLKDLGFDLQKQFHFYGALDRNFCWSLLTCKQDELIAVLSNVAGFSDKVKLFHDLQDERKEAGRISYKNESRIIQLNSFIKHFDKLLPCEEFVWQPEFTAYTISRLKREEIERSKKIEELDNVRGELRNIDNLNLQRSITDHTMLKNQKQQRNREVREIFQQRGFKDDEDETAFKFRICTIEKTIVANNIHIQNHQTHIVEFERYKTTCEANIALINTLNGTRKRSPVLTEDSLLKLYPVFHGSDELEMDRRELELLERQEELNKIEIKRETDQQFELWFPELKTNQTVKDYRETFIELISSFRGIFNPNAYLHSFDELKLEVLHSKICSSKGFVLCKGLLPVDEEHKNLINNILSEFKDTIVLYKNETIGISAMLKRVHPVWFQNVRFLVLTSVTGGEHLGYVPPPDHWLNYCKYNVYGGTDTARSKLMYHLGVKHKIICVERHETVQREFRRNAKKYVASVDGQLIYTRNAMGIDVLMYFQPGKPVKTMHFPEACQRLKNSFTKVTEWMSGLIEPENKPRDFGPDVDTSGLQAEIDTMKEDFAKLKVDQIDRMEALRQRLNEPIDVADVQNYADRLQEEQDSLQEMNNGIAEARRGIEGLQMEERAMSREKDSKNLYIQLKAELKKNETEIILHNKTIKENETEIKKNEERKDKLEMENERLQSDIKNLKYKTIRTVRRAEQEGVDLTTIGCTTPDTLENIRNGTYIEPRDSRILFDDMTDTFDENKIYGRREMYNWLGNAKASRAIARTKQNQSERTIYDLDKKIEELKSYLDQAFNNFNNAMTQIINNIANDSDVEFEYEFLFDYENITRTSNMIIVKSYGHVIGFDALSIEDQAITYWLLFAALNQYSKAPFAFIDLLDVTVEITDCVAPIVRQIATKTQLFIISSHIHHLDYANLQFAINEKIHQSGRRLSRIFKHVSPKYVKPRYEIVSSQRTVADSIPRRTKLNFNF